MQTNTLPTKPEKAPLKRLLSAPIIVLAILAGAFFLELKWLGRSLLIFHQTESGWKEIPAPGSYLEALQVSSSGMVWALTLGHAPLSRWDGASWRNYNSSDFGTKTNHVVAGYALDGEQVWASTREGVLHWDGQRWQCYREAAADFGASIVAGGGEVWVLDRTGKLSHFDRGQWHSSQAALPGRNWDDSPRALRPRLARAGDGSVWVVAQGVWRFDGANWVRQTAGANLLKDAVLIGVAGDHLWLWDLAGLRFVSTDGKQWTLYPSEQTGLAKTERAHDVVSTGGSSWFATEAGVLEFNGSLWRRLPPPSTRVAGISSIAAAPGRELWVIGSPKGLGSLLLLAFLTPLAILAVIVWMLVRRRRRARQQHQRVTQAVQYATGEIPEELKQGEKRLAWSGGLETAVLWIGTGAGYWLLRSVWPKAPFWTIPIIAVAIHLAITFQQSLVKRKANPYDPIGPGAPSQYNWGKTWKATAGALLIILLINLDELPMLKLLRGYWLWILVLVPSVYHGLGVYLLNRAARRGDYDAALNIIRWFHFYNPSGMEPLRMSGHMLLAAGRYREAEETLRRSLVSSHARESYGEALEYLGDVLMEQGRCDEAMRSYEAGLLAFPWRRRPYRGMAEMLLRQEKNSQQALEYVEKIVDFSGLSWRERQGNGRSQDDYWALKAWALARIGRSSEVAQAVENALRATAKNCRPDLATTHYRAGMAMQALGNQSAANEHFERALDLDPNGRRGALAKEALRQASVWGAIRVRESA
jgi:tetratricopeptide (TPR) repeat protein